jgi:hypothetical protein
MVLFCAISRQSPFQSSYVVAVLSWPPIKPVILMRAQNVNVSAWSLKAVDSRNKTI